MNMICECCGNSHLGEYGSGRFCDSKCSRSFSTKSKRSEINKRVSDKMTKPLVVKICFNPNCNNEFTGNKTYCSLKCYNSTDIHKEKSRIGGIISATSQQKRSKNEILFANLCINNFNKVLCNEPIFNGWDSDIILEDEKIAILWNGNWHYKKLTKSHSLEQVQNRDRIKIQEIINCGYKPYIIKDPGRYNENFVFGEFEKLKMAM